MGVNELGQKSMPETSLDPKGVIRDSYKIEGISEPECRSIFLDWAISVPDDCDACALIPELIAQHGNKAPDHPMTKVLNEGLGSATSTGRRGGRRTRVKSLKKT